MSYHTRPDARKEEVSSGTDGAEEHKEHEIEEEEDECKGSHHGRVSGIRKIMEKYSY